MIPPRVAGMGGMQRKERHGKERNKEPSCVKTHEG